MVIFTSFCPKMHLILHFWADFTLYFVVQNTFYHDIWYLSTVKYKICHKIILFNTISCYSHKIQKTTQNRYIMRFRVVSFLNYANFL